MDIIGLKITDVLDNSTFVFNETTSPGAILFSGYLRGSQYPLHPDGGWLTYQYTFPDPIPDGYEIQMPGAGSAEVLFRQIGDRRYVSGIADKFTLNMSTDRKLTVKGLTTRQYDEFSNYAQLFAYPTTDAKSEAKAGLKIMGNNVFFNPIYKNGYAYAVIRKKVTINGKFRPSQLDPSLTMTNAVYFFYCENASSYITHKYDMNDKGTRIEDHYFLCRNKNNVDSNHSSSGEFYIIAFANKAPSELDTYRGAGLKLRNTDGLTTYSSALKVLTKPVNVQANKINVNSATSISGISRPMYSPSVYGETFRSDGGAGQFRSLNISNFDKNTVSFAEMNSWWARGHHGDYTVARSSAPIIFLDASDYFYFP